MDVAKFSPETYSAKRAEVIGSQGMPLEVSEMINILKLGLQEVEVYGETAILASASGTAKQILAPSKAGPALKIHMWCEKLKVQSIFTY